MAGLVGLSAAMGLSVASVAYELSLGSHGGVTGPPRNLAVAADVAGVLVSTVVVLQIFAGYGLFAESARAQRGLHVTLAWAVGGLLLVHGLTAAIHASARPTSGATVGLAVMGAVAAVAAGYQFTTGRRQSRGHVGTAQIATALVTLHVLVGVWHAVTG